MAHQKNISHRLRPEPVINLEIKNVPGYTLSFDNGSEMIVWREYKISNNAISNNPQHLNYIGNVTYDVEVNDDSADADESVFVIRSDNERYNKI